jgi:hypothetical protein
MAANYRHIGDRENRLGRHYSRFSPFWPTPALAGQSLALRKLCDAGSNRRSQASAFRWCREARLADGARSAAASVRPTWRCTRRAPRRRKARPSTPAKASMPCPPPDPVSQSRSIRQQICARSPMGRRVELGVAQSRIPALPKLTNPASLRGRAPYSVHSQRPMGKHRMRPFIPLRSAGIKGPVERAFRRVRGRPAPDIAESRPRIRG